MNESQRRVLLSLPREGDISESELRDRLNMGRERLVGTLRALGASGFVLYSDPGYRWALTPKGHFRRSMLAWRSPA